MKKEDPVSKLEEIIQTAIKADCMVIDPKTKTWRGTLPSGCRSVHVQWLGPDDYWYPKLSTSVQRNRTASIELLEQAMHGKIPGKTVFRAYRLIPAVSEEENNSTEKKFMSEKKVKAPKEPKNKEAVVLVADRFHPDSDVGKMYTLLSDGKARTIDEIQAVVKAKVKGNIGVGKYSVLRKFGQESKKFTMSKEDGKIKMTMTGAEEKKVSSKSKVDATAPVKKVKTEKVDEKPAATKEVTSKKKKPVKAPKKEGKKASGVQVSE